MNPHFPGPRRDLDEGEKERIKAGLIQTGVGISPGNLVTGVSEQESIAADDVRRVMRLLIESGELELDRNMLVRSVGEDQNQLLPIE